MDNTSQSFRNLTYLNQTPDLSQMMYPRPLEYKPLWEMVIKIICYVPLIVYALIGNIMIIVVVAKNKRMQTTTNYYIVNLAVADCLVTLTCTWVHLVDDLTPMWVLGAFFCTFNTFTQIMTLVASIFTLTFIACDRFFGIVFAMKAHFIERRASCTIIFIWLLSAIVASPMFFIRKQHVIHWKNLDEIWCDDDWPMVLTVDPETGRLETDSPASKAYYFFVCGALFFLPVVVMGVAYAVIIVTLWSAQVPGERISKDIKSQTKMRKKVIAMLVVILTVFVICWAPIVVCIVYSETIHKREKFKPWYRDFYYFARYLSHFNSVVNPFIYAGFNDNFKKGFQALCHGGERRARYNSMVSRVDSFQSSTHMTKV